MENMAITVLAVIILVLGVYQQVTFHPKAGTKVANKDKVLSASTSAQVSVAPTLTATPQVTSTPHYNSIVPTATPTPQPTSVINTGLITESLRYPGAVVQSSSDTHLLLQSGDGAETITNWYKDKLKSLHFNVNSFVTTKANDKVLNKLVSANGKTEVRVTISQDSGSGAVNIDVTVSSS